MKKNEKKPVEDKTRNDNIAAALAYLRSTYPESLDTNEKLAKKIGIDEDTITNIINYYTRPSDATISKLYVNTGKIFNLSFLLGQSSVMLTKDVPVENPEKQAVEQPFTALLAAKDEIIANLRSHMDEKKEEIAFMRSQLVEKDKLISTLQQQVDDLRMQVASEKGLHSTGISHSEAAEHPSTSAYDME